MCRKRLFRQMSHYTDNFLRKSQSGFRKRSSKQYFLLKILESWKSPAAEGKSFDVVLTDLSNAFDCFPIIFDAYSFSLSEFKLIQIEKQETKTEN